KYVDTMKQTVGLAETCLEGIEHIKSRFNEGHFEDTIRLFRDSVEAYYHMERAIQALPKKLAANQLEERTESLRKAFEHVVSAYKKGDRGKAQEIIQFTLQPAFKKWKSELEKAFAPYIVS